MKRESSIDIFKFISSILIVAIHTRPFQNISKEADFYFVDVICRLAVPFFCICTGYYLYSRLYFENDKLILCKENQNTIKKYTISIVKMYIIWSIIYLIIQILEWIKAGWFSVYAFLDWGISFVSKGSYYHLWYLLCIIYAMPILYCFLRKYKLKKIIKIGIILYGIEVLGYGYRQFLPISIQVFYNMLDILGCFVTATTRVLPFLMLGIYIGYKGKLEFKNSLIGIVISIVLLTLEASSLKMHGHNSVSYIFMTYSAAFYMFNLIININKYINFSNTKMLANISTGIYCVHPMVIFFLKRVFMGLESFKLFILTSLISFLIVCCFYFLKNLSKK